MLPLKMLKFSGLTAGPKLYIRWLTTEHTLVVQINLETPPSLVDQINPEIMHSPCQVVIQPITKQSLYKQIQGIKYKIVSFNLYLKIMKNSLGQVI